MIEKWKDSYFDELFVKRCYFKCTKGTNKSNQWIVKNSKDKINIERNFFFNDNNLQLRRKNEISSALDHLPFIRGSLFVRII
jgi:hypothetical protein